MSNVVLAGRVGVDTRVARTRSAVMDAVKRFHEDDRGDMLQYFIIAAVVLTIGYALLRTFFNGPMTQAFDSLGRWLGNIFAEGDTNQGS